MKRKKVNKKSKCVYVHYMNGKPFYVGQGSIYRATKDFYGRDEEWKEIFDRDGFSVEILAENLNLEEALDLETKTIKKIGLKNLTNSSDKRYSGGLVGTKRSKESIEKMKATRIEKGLNTKEKFYQSKYRVEYAKKMTKLTDDQINEIISIQDKRLIAGETTVEIQNDLGSKYNVSPLTIAQIRNRAFRFKAWPETITAKKIGYGWEYRYLEEGEKTFRPITKKKLKRINKNKK